MAAERQILLGIVCQVLFCTCAFPAMAQVLAEKSEQERSETTRLITAELPNWKFRKGGSSSLELTLQPKSALNWTNPSTGRVYGDLYFWTRDGRPEIAMTLFKAWEPANGFHVELHSLSNEIVQAERKQQSVWRTKQAGIEWKPLSDAPSPAELPVRRLAQMRLLARQFSVTLTDFRQNETGEKQALRVLPQPVYRYQSITAELIDGAVFAFVLGTDPEVLLLLEARQGTDGPEWLYSLARMNNHSLIVTRNENLVMEFERVESRYEMTDPYVLKRIPETP